MNRRVIISIERGTYRGDWNGVQRMADFDELPCNDEDLAAYLLYMFKDLDRTLDKAQRPSEFE